MAAACIQLKKKHRLNSVRNGKGKRHLGFILDAWWVSLRWLQQDLTERNVGDIAEFHVVSIFLYIQY